MKLVMTLLVRDEADIVDAQIAYHLHAGVDYVIATDNASQDGTTEILERYVRAGVLHLIHEPGQNMRQDLWVTHMARLAATEFGADWVINADADEFWWPRAGSLKDVLATIPERYGVVRGCWRHFLPRPLDDASTFFAERMTVRLRAPAHPGAKETIFHAHQKVAHRADPRVRISFGNHDAEGANLSPLRGWHPVEVLHFSLRSVAQVERKSRRIWWADHPDDVALHQQLAYEAIRDGRVVEYYESLAVSDETVTRGIRDGTLAFDERLRDALRQIRDGDTFRLPSSSAPALTFGRPDVLEDATLAAETAVLADIDGVVRAEERVDAFERRLAAIEQGPLSRLRRLGLLSR
jgi:Glycosyl transferase family 2